MAHPVFRFLARPVVAVALAALALLAYASYAERAAEARARAFCSGLSLGDAPESLLRKAAAAGAEARHTRWFRSEGQESWLPVTFTGAFPLSRHICSVRATSVIQSAEYLHLD